MFNEITYYSVFGVPLIVYGGAAAFIMFVATAVVAGAARKGYIRLNVKWHFRMAYISIALGLFHALFGILAYL